MNDDINSEIMELMNGVQLNKPMDNSGLNQMRNIVNALDNVITQMNGSNSPFEPLVKSVREFYFRSMVEANNIFMYDSGSCK